MKNFNFIHQIVTDGRIILMDEYMPKEVQNELLNLRTTDHQELIFLESKELAIELEKMLEAITKQEDRILFVFPGNGSNYPKKLSMIWQDYLSSGVMAKRIWSPGVDPVVVVDLIKPEMFLILNIKTILVVDDVISSGSTMRKLYQKNYWRFPSAKWIGASWVSQNLETGIKGYEYINSVCMVKKNNVGKVPINSLSTLRQNHEIAESYAKRHFQEPKVFLEILQSSG